MFSTAVISARKADEHYLKMQSEHSDMLLSMQIQQMRVQALNQQKDVQKQNDKQNQDTMQFEREKDTNATSVSQQKNALDFQNKQDELSIKRQALNSV